MESSAPAPLEEEKIALEETIPQSETDTADYSYFFIDQVPLRERLAACRASAAPGERNVHQVAKWAEADSEIL
jgi:GH43 family beta-xylosidase